jgi:hypothetical protein
MATEFVISGVQETISEQENSVPQGLFEQFPKQINRENISSNATNAMSVLGPF